MNKNFLNLIIFVLSVLTLVSCSEPANYDVIILDNNVDNKTINDIATSIYNDAVSKNPAVEDLILNVKSNNIQSKFGLTLPGFASDKDRIKLIDDSLDSNINSIHNKIVSNPNESANNQIEELARVLSNIKDYTTVFIAGKFPNCYDKENSEKALNILKKNLTIKDSSLIEINWMLQSNSEEPESILLDYLKNSGITFNNNQITVAKRVCTSSSRNVFSVFFNPLDSSDVISFEKFLSTNFGKNVNLKIWNDSKINDRIISSNQNAQFQASDRKILNELSKGQWTSIGYLIKQATNEFAAMHDSVKKDLIIVAPLPLENKGKEIDPNVWKTLSTIKNLNVYYIYPGKVNLSLVDKAFKGGFKKNNINISEIKL